MRVIIAGGGTGGLAAAIALRKVGIEPLVLEQAAAFTAIGAGLGLYANAMKALTYLGADVFWRENAARIDVAEQRGLNDDELITSSSLDPQAAKYGEHYYCGHRADLLSSLLAPLRPESVRTGSRVVAFEETDRDVRVELATGEEVRGDLLVGADGLRSQTRQQLMGEREARFTGVVVWRGLIPREKVPQRYDAKIMSWYGPRRHVLLYPLRHDQHPGSVYSLSAFVPATEVNRESWTASGDLADLHASLADSCPAMHELLALMDTALITGIYFRDPLETWGSRTASSCWATPRTRRRPAPVKGRHGPGRRRHARRLLAAGRGRERAGSLAGVHVPPPGAYHEDARVVPGELAQQPDQRSGPGPGAQRLCPRTAAAQPGRPAHAGMAARAQPGRGRAAVTRRVRAEPGRSNQSDAQAGVAAGLRPVARGADG